MGQLPGGRQTDRAGQPTRTQLAELGLGRAVGGRGGQVCRSRSSVGMALDMNLEHASNKQFQSMRKMPLLESKQRKGFL